MKINTFRKAFQPEIMPLFAWANSQLAKPFPKITRWQIDRNSLITKIEVRHD